MKKAKILHGCLILVVLSAFALSACGKNDDAGEGATSSVAASSTASESPSETASESSSPSPSASASESATPSDESSAQPSKEPSESASASPSEDHSKHEDDSPSESPSKSPPASAETSEPASASPSASASESASPSPSASEETGDGEDKKKVVVEIKDFAFSPSEITIEKGTTVTFVNRDKMKHSATADNGEFDTKLIAQNDSVEVKFDDVGKFGYYCIPHEYMTGTITVKDK